MEQKLIHNHTPPSIAAAVAIRPHVPTQRARILAYIDSCGSDGATREEVENALELDGNSVRPRIRALIQDKELVQLYQIYRQTNQGFWAAVVVSKRHAEGLT